MEKVKFYTYLILVSLSILFLPFLTYSSTQVTYKKGESISEIKKYTNKSDNNKCLKCHASRKYAMTSSSDSTKIIFRKMPLDYMIDTAQYYMSNHWNFKCNECHSEKYVKVPHNQELRFEDKPVCIDCHGGDKKFAKYKFEIVDAEYKKSVHSIRQNTNFSCWSCHNPHTYKINAGNKHQKITKTIEYDNNICLGCHDNNDNLKYFNKEISSIVKTHKWLPNQIDHFRKVRCIECHAVINDSIIASHNIQPKVKAVKECSKCHSPTSILMRSLYKDYSKSERMGFLNSIVLNDSYVAGTNRNYFLNLISIITITLTFLGIFIHIILRITNK
jgi:Zn finger protein HypA/HybF involved in hydrogenase expression